MVCGIPICRSSEIKYRRAVSLRRESPFRGRRLRVHESLMERAVMSPLGYQFLLHLAPRIDKVLIPPTNGRLSSMGIGKVGLVTTTGCEVRVAAHAAADIDQRLRRAARDRVQLRAPAASGLERQPAGASRMHGRVHGSDRAVPSRAAHRRRPRLGMGQRLPTSTPVTSATGPAAHHARSGSFGSGLPPEDGIGLLAICGVHGLFSLPSSVRSLTAHERPVLLAICVSFRSPTSTDLVPAAFAPPSTGWARNTAPRATRFF